MPDWRSRSKGEVLPRSAERRANRQAEKPQVGRPIRIIEPFTMMGMDGDSNL